MDRQGVPDVPSDVTEGIPHLPSGMIETRRLNLVPASRAMLLADLSGPEDLGRELHAVVPPSWPPEHYDDQAVKWTLDRVRAAPPGTESFWGYYFVWRDAPPGALLIGVGGFKGPPEDGVVELGYSVVADQQRRGFATEAVHGMLGFAFAHPEVAEVTAQTLPHLRPSIGVLEKTGFHYRGPGAAAGAIVYVMARDRWQRSQARNPNQP
jgi:RimJ/RimL family protein N-acetyltransferase